MMKLCFVILSCAVAGAVSARDNGEPSRAVRTITISPDIQMPRVVVWAETTPIKSPENKLGVPEALRTEFAQAIRKSGRFKLKEAGPADAELRLRVYVYGFGQDGWFTSKVKPVLVVRAELVRPDGIAVLKFRDAVTEKNKNVPELPYSKVHYHLEAGADALHVAARLVAEKFTQQIRM